MKVALVHDWLVSYRGGEKVLETIASMFPDAPIYTLFYDSQSLPEALTKRDIRYPKTLNRFRRFRKAMLPLLPACIESLELSDYDLVISTSSCVAKGIIPGPDSLHLCYLHSPMRYIWDQQSEYLKGFEGIPFVGALFRLLSVKLRMWDQLSSTRVDQFIVNSKFVGKRVRKYYGSESHVIHPPIDTDYFCPETKTETKDDEYYLAAGALVPYKGFEIAIHACERAGKKLIIAGNGPGLKSLQKKAGQFTEFRIAPKDDEWRSLLRGARALLFPGVEDFGMVAVEAMACGTPVIALEKGGALDFIKPGVSGVFVSSQDPGQWCDVLSSFDPQQFDEQKIRDFAVEFGQKRFEKQFSESVRRLKGES